MFPKFIIRHLSTESPSKIVTSREKGALVEINDKLRAIGVPQDISQRRKVLIFKPSRTAMQAGKSQTKQWALKFNTAPKWENPLMGWTSSNDAVQGIIMNFNTKEEAMRYAEDQGLTYEVKDPFEAIITPKSYSSNFTYSKGKLKIIRTK
jgi:NADH dehydrogenase (ubiquinone) Fe-S protein 4